MNLIWCSGFPEIYTGLEEGVESVHHGYMCILQYVKLICCTGFPKFYARIGGEGGVSLSWVYVQYSICETYFLYCHFP